MHSIHVTGTSLADHTELWETGNRAVRPLSQLQIAKTWNTPIWTASRFSVKLEPEWKPPGQLQRYIRAVIRIHFSLMKKELSKKQSCPKQSSWFVSEAVRTQLFVITKATERESLSNCPWTGSLFLKPELVYSIHPGKGGRLLPSPSSEPCPVQFFIWATLCIKEDWIVGGGIPHLLFSILRIGSWAFKLSNNYIQQSMTLK